MEKMIETKNLNKKYGKFQALDNVSINLYKGDIYGLIGKNGAGKSTFFKVLMGLSLSTGGTIHIEGSHTSNELNHARKNIGFMMGTNFFPYLNGRENLEYFCKLKGIHDEKEIERVLTLVEMNGVNKKYKAYSMGMKQRISIANALLGSPDIVILDEPINGLDPEGISDFRHIIQSLNQEEGITFIISSHILGELGLMANRFGFLHKGRLVEELDQKTLQERTEHQLVVKVDNSEKAAYLLEEVLHTTNFVVNGQKELVLSDYVHESNKVAKVFVENGLEVYKLSPNETSLEQYFLNLVGGEEHV